MFTPWSDAMFMMPTIASACISHNESMDRSSAVRVPEPTSLEASLHNLLTSARLWRVLKHCTWEKTTVAMSKCGSKIGRFVSGTHMPLWVDMVAREGEWGGFLVHFC